MAKEIKNSSRGRTPTGEPNPIDIHVGNRIKLRRTLLGLSQEKLASLLGLTFQQVQKYERGSNRVGASRLWDISKVLQTNISFFFEDMNLETAQNSPRNLLSKDLDSLVIADITVGDNDPMQRAETLELITAFYKINNRKAAKHLFDMVIAMSKTSGLKNNKSITIRRKLMNNKKAKAIRRLAEKRTIGLPDTEYLRKKTGQIIVNPESTRGEYKKLKKAYKKSARKNNRVTID